MLNSCLKIVFKDDVYKIILGLSFIFSGCSIYLLFRSSELNIYQWFGGIGMSECVDSLRCAVIGWSVPDFVKYNLPDGLYCAAYILLIDAIWGRRNGIAKYVFISIVPIATIICEILQYLGIVNGTFDVSDLICYAIPILIYGLIEFKKKVFTN